jgi:hypothetical protein
LVILALVNHAAPLALFVLLLLAVGLIAVRDQRLFLAMFMFWTVLVNTRDFAPSLGMAFGGISVYPEDLVTIVCGCAALARIPQWRLRGITRTAALVYAILVASGVISWISTFGIQQGTNSWRAEMLTVALLLYTTTPPRAWTWNDLRVLIVWPAIAISIAGALGILMFGFGSSSSSVEVRGVLEAGRPVWAPGSLLILGGLWVTLLSVGRWTATRVLVILLLGSMVLLTQNRSVWVAAVLGGVAWWLVPRIRARGGLSGLSGLNRSLIVLPIASATAIVGSSMASLAESASSEGTWLWRVARWSASMSIPRSWVEWLAGSAFGPTPVSTPGLFPTFAHSFYIDDIEKTGFIGLATLLILITAVGKAYVPSRFGVLGLIVCVSYLGYGTAYQVPPWAWMLAGILLTSTLIDKPGGSRGVTGNTITNVTRPGRREKVLSIANGCDGN